MKNKNIGKYKCEKCGEEILNVPRIIQKHICNKNITIKTNKEIEQKNDKTNIDIPSNDSFIDLLRKEIKNKNKITLNFDGLIIEGIVIKLENKMKRIFIKDSFNQIFQVSFDCFKQKYTNHFNDL